MLGVFDSHRVLSTTGGVGVHRFTLNFESTASELKGTSPAPQKLVQILAFVKARSKAVLKATRKDSLLIWLMWLRMKPLISVPYARFNGEKHPHLAAVVDVTRVLAYKV